MGYLNQCHPLAQSSQISFGKSIPCYASRLAVFYSSITNIYIYIYTKEHNLENNEFTESLLLMKET